MERILVPLHTGPDGTLPKAALEAVAAARRLADALSGTELVVGIVGERPEAAAERIGGCGAARVLAVSGSEFDQSRYASDVAAVEALAREAGATLVLAPGTPRWSRALPGVAHRLGGQIDTHVVETGAADGTVTVTRWFYRQRMRGTLERSQRPWVIALDPGSTDAWTGEPAKVPVEAVGVELPEACRRTTVQGVEEPPADQQTIRPDAELLFVAGAGWTKKQADGQTHPEDAERLILAFLAASQASLGGSKSLVDLSGGGHAVLGFMSHLNQVGQTGATPRHPKGLSTCCHGEEPHAVGWRFITERRAINLDPNCGWAQGKADVVYVADAFQVMSRVNALLGQGGG